MNTVINSLQQPSLHKTNSTGALPSPGQAQANFATFLKDSINKVNNIQNLSDAKTTKMAQGEIDDLHDVMITAQKASITLETSVQIQRKVIDAYNEVMRMQV